jgi:CRP/FNR family transcriptional regulator
MLTNSELDRLRQVMPVLMGADPALVQEFQHAAYMAKIPAGHDVFLEGDKVEAIALLISGAVRVYKIGETGREITLYRFGNGESCVLTANAILNNQTFPAIAAVEWDAEAVMIPADVFRGWVGRFDAWREFVFELFSQRLLSVMQIVDDVAFRRMDVRVVSYLLKRAQSQDLIRVTHQEIASELGSSREVISRLLEDLSERGWLRVARGEVHILDAESLRSHYSV